MGLTGRSELFDMRLRKASATVTNARQLAMHKAFAEYEAVRMDIAVTLRTCIESKGGKVEDLFDAVCTSGSDRVSKTEIRTYLSGVLGQDMEPGKLDKVFATAVVDEPDTNTIVHHPPNTIGKVDFSRMVRVFYKVVKEIVLSDNLRIEDAKQLRRMEIGEVLEVYEGPVMDDSVQVYRVRGCALKDGACGWVTIAGNQGVVFLMPGGNVFKVSKPVALTVAMQDVHAKNVVRELKESEVLEVLDWARTARAPMGATRVKVKVQSDGMKGWVTIGDATGTTYLEAA